MSSKYQFKKKNKQIILEFDETGEKDKIKAMIQSIVKTVPLLQNVFFYERAISFLQVEDVEKITKNNSNLYQDVCRILYDLKKQQDYLLSLGYSFYMISIDDVVCINSYYVFLNTDYIKPYNKKTREMLFQTPFDKKETKSNKYKLFSSPEMNAITRLPANLSITSYDFSLAELVFFLLFDKEYRENVEESIVCLQTIRGTKLYYFFLRIFDTQHPTFLYI
jgi:hypothetical protein